MCPKWDFFGSSINGGQLDFTWCTRVRKYRNVTGSLDKKFHFTVNLLWRNRRNWNWFEKRLKNKIKKESLDNIRGFYAQNDNFNRRFRNSCINAPVPNPKLLQKTAFI